MTPTIGLRLCMYLLVLAVCAATACSRKSQPQNGTPSPTGAAKPLPQTGDPRKAAIVEYQRALQSINRSRIIGGQYAEPGQLPWQSALIMAGYPVREGEFCGGSIIDPSWVLTAAHCVTGMQGDDFYVFAGNVDLTKPGENIPVQQIYVHERFNNLTFDNDLALLHLSKAVQSGKPISLLQPSEASTVLVPRRRGRVSGWGRVQEDGLHSALLKYVDVPIADQAQCAKNYASKQPVTANMLCAGFDTSDTGDACKGDSGGPFAVPVGDEFKLAGTVSFGEGCARAGFYGIYTRVVNYLPWISNRVTPSTVARAEPVPRAPWMTGIEWALTNTAAGGSTDCPWEYSYPGCVVSGGRACLIVRLLT